MEERVSSLTSAVAPGYGGYVKPLICLNCERAFSVSADEYEVNETKFCRECSAFVLHVSSLTGCALCIQRVAWVKSEPVEVKHVLDIAWDITACITRSNIPQVDQGRLSFGAYLMLNQIHVEVNGDNSEEESEISKRASEE
ncbi:MAG: hypothetical protein NVSMB44_00100 [Ktedonobacteraceae bacterium]